MLLQSFIVGLMIGAGGSMHCLAMCGPLVLRFQSRIAGGLRQYLAFIAYHLGRVSSYIFLGTIFGMLGMSVAILRAGQFFAIAAGIVIILLSLGKYNPHWPIFQHISNKIAKYIGNEILTSGSNVPDYVAGILNGFLPCGLVLVAITTAASLGTLSGAIVLMAGFGLGTIPLLLTMIIIHRAVNPFIRSRFSRFANVISIVIGILLIIRGLNLGIPYLSPYIDQFDLLRSMVHCK
ncbi:MAG: sulfite exporter TauE/SafE family protein [Saprospiraceae bacterium]